LFDDEAQKGREAAAVTEVEIRQHPLELIMNGGLLYNTVRGATAYSRLKQRAPPRKQNYTVPSPAFPILGHSLVTISSY
jgi:hypothetical protein